MFKKTKEKINQNEYVVLIKKIWDNKRYRSLLVLVLYFIFFFIIIVGLRSTYQNNENNNDSNPFSFETLEEKYSNLQDYTYSIFVNDILTIEGELKQSINSFKYNDENYTIINNNIYQEKDENLEKIDLEELDQLILIANKIKLGDFINYISTLNSSGEINDNSYKLDFELPNSYFSIEEEGNIQVSIFGEPNSELDEIVIDLSDYKKEMYIITVRVSDNNVSSIK